MPIELSYKALGCCFGFDSTQIAITNWLLVVVVNETRLSIKGSMVIYSVIHLCNLANRKC